MKEDIYLSVVIPAYNEMEGIADTLVDISRYLFSQNYVSEIIVVNDGSKDNTSEVVKKLQGTIHNLKFIDNKKNQGKGSAVKQGILAAQGRYRLYVDADNAISIDHIDKFWPYLKEGYDIVIGSIEIKGAVKKEKYAGYRKILGKLSKYLIRILTIWKIHDTQRAFKLFPAEVAEKVFSQQTIMRWGFDIEILVIANNMGYKIKEMPVVWINPSGGRVTLMSYINTLIELIIIKINLLSGKYKKSL
ncbi:MAG: dolichyl-phosphate beta-glucosyltransferase [Patescibacteria group bacterium]